MKGLKKFYKENRIFCILMMISMLCFVIMGVAVIAYFINQTSSSSYGNRLKGMEKYSVDSELNLVEEFYKSEKNVKNSKTRVQGKIIYIDVEVEKSVSNDDIKSMAVGSLEKLTDEQKEVYDIQFVFTREDTVPFFGSKSSENTIISWTNYNVDSEQTTTTKKSK